MAEILGSTYEILKKIGSGGRGVVYLAQHLRLNKFVIVKVDKHRSSVAPEEVQREMKVLKNLSHTYIPHLYDYFQDSEKDAAYTVMDYIEGESLDNPLNRGEHFSQVQVIPWACQLLDALDYLHTRKPHGYVHGDVKPSNIMLTPDGDIRLIDFNIALALGDDNTVVGRTEGYASPEHYRVSAEETELLVEVGADSQSDEPAMVSAVSSSSPSSPFMMPLDARSDIYSVGATLYHLLSGHRPAKRAVDVKPLDTSVASAPVLAIIQKAMAPDPEDRYQTAAEMKEALEQIPTRDPRAVRHRRIRYFAVAFSLALFLAGGTLTLLGLKQKGDIQRAYALSRDSEAALQVGNVDAALCDAMEALRVTDGTFSVPPVPQARRALTNALGVYDIPASFHAHKLVTLPSEPIKTAISPDGSLIAVLVEKEIRVYNTETGNETAGPFAAEYSALSSVVFLDNHTLIYSGDGALSAYDLAAPAPLWTAGNPATDIAVSADGSTVAGVYKDETMAVLYDARTGEAVQVVDFDDKRPNAMADSLLTDQGGRIFALDKSAQWLAVSFQEGGLSLFDIQNFREIVLQDVSPYTAFEGGFSGSFFAWSATGNQGSIFSVYNLETMSPVGSIQSGSPFHVQADESGVFVSNLQMDGEVLRSYAENTLIRMNLPTWSGTEVVRTNGSIASFVCNRDKTLVVTTDARCLAFNGECKAMPTAGKDSRIDFAHMAGDYILTANRNAPWLRLQKWESHAEAIMFSYDPSFYHSEARVTPDGYTAILFNYSQFRIITRTGEVIADVPIPDGANVYSIYYWKDRDLLDARYYDGLVRSYSVKNGALISEEQGDPPDGSHNGVYVTEDYVVDAPLHGVASLSDQEGDAIGTLNPEGYVYDAMQVDEYLIPLYLTTDDERYGLLMDKDGEILGDLPRLTDVLPNGTLIFDDGNGNLYQSRIYSLEELTDMAERRSQS